MTTKSHENEFMQDHGNNTSSSPSSAARRYVTNERQSDKNLGFSFYEITCWVVLPNGRRSSVSPMHVYACYVPSVSYPGLIPSVALHGVLPGLPCYKLTLFFFYSRTGCNRFGNAMRGIFGVVAFLAATGNVNIIPVQ